MFRPTLPRALPDTFFPSANGRGIVSLKGETVFVVDDRELVRRAEASHADMLATRQKLAGARSLYETQRSVTATG